VSKRLQTATEIVLYSRINITD